MDKILCSGCKLCTAKKTKERTKLMKGRMNFKIIKFENSYQALD